MRFQNEPNRKHLLQHVCRYRDQPHFPIGQGDDDALARQGMQRATHRYATDTERIGEFALNQPLALHQVPMNGGAYNRIGHLVTKIFGPFMTHKGKYTVAH
ncbi:hypothetical protein C7413_11298 [Paraburkholderia silvatlantica]|nr:hypothetical protein C7411_11298 [Paraburkholderia silvatlantica]PXW37211.1 hypothetical protein C7413_11298 [Paraburkholderia silvatlantica]